MKLKRKSKLKGYGRLKRKILLQMTGLVLASIFFIWFIYQGFLNQRFGNAFVAVLTGVFGLSDERAHMVYSERISNNYIPIVFAAIVFCFCVMFFFSVNWFMKYFREIDKGMDTLAEKERKPIELSSEMKPMQDKMNGVRAELNQQFQEIREAEKKKDELVMYLAHDIRTPLTSVIGYLNLMKDMPDVTAVQRAEFLNITIEKANRLEMLVNEFFDITRMNRQDLIVSKEEVDLPLLLSQLKEEAYPQLQEKKKTLFVEIHDKCVIYANGEKLARVLNNLIKNAIAYSDEGSEICIQADEDEKMTRICVASHGRTITKEEQDKLFVKFYRLDEARQSDRGGAGLGLAIARELIERQAGTLSVASERGVTVFTILLPKKEC